MRILWLGHTQGSVGVDQDGVEFDDERRLVWVFVMGILLVVSNTVQVMAQWAAAIMMHSRHHSGERGVSGCGDFLVGVAAPGDMAALGRARNFSGTVGHGASQGHGRVRDVDGRRAAARSGPRDGAGTTISRHRRMGRSGRTGAARPAEDDAALDSLRAHVTP